MAIGEGEGGVAQPKSIIKGWILEGIKGYITKLDQSLVFYNGMEGATVKLIIQGRIQ